MDTAKPQGSGPYFLEVPFSKRWEYHKDTIKRLFVDEGNTFEETAKTMKDHYRFDANVRQYKYHLKQWNITKSVPSSVKEKAIEAIGKRKRDGSAVAGVRYKGEEIDKKRLRRYMNTQANKPDQDLQFNNNVFTYWNLPYEAFKASSINEADASSPFGVNGSTPSDISVFSPAYAAVGPSPRSAPSPMNAPTPTTIAIRDKSFNNRAKYLIQGMHDEFLKDMQNHEKRIATTWLYQFWHFSFKTMKYWGKGPLHWTPGMLGFTEFLDSNTTRNTPAAIVGTPAKHTMSEANICTNVREKPNSEQDPNKPSSLCRWSIHYYNEELVYEELPLPRTEPYENLDLNNPDSWPAWTENADHEKLIHHLQEALKTNSFSNIEAKDLPLSTTQIVKAAQRSPGELLEEAIGFAIMARNYDLLFQLLNKRPRVDLNLTRLFPFHLATSYMDGAESCCNIVDLTVRSLAGPNLIKNLYVNDLGYTVLDNLMISILKAHTSCLPVIIDDRQKLSKRFDGEEVDICGRWDADSPCVRTLLANGNPAIPFSWKHMFCHTSAQTICHSIATIFYPSYAPDINTLSGLFVKICENCNRKLQVGPLHCLVLTTFYLAQSGCEGENLFGILACLVCLLAHGADPLQKAEISVKALLGTDNGDECSHTSIDPVELADQVLEVFMATWTDKVKLGWQVTTDVLRCAQQERSQIRKQRSQGGGAMGLHYNDESEAFTDRGDDSDDVVASDQDSDEVEDDGHGGLCEHQHLENVYGKSKDLGTLWARIQTELLNYRRIKEEDPWISKYFSMRSLLDGLDAGAWFSFLPLADRKMMKPFCKCGRFSDASYGSCAIVTEFSPFYFSDLEDWKRSNYISFPPFGVPAVRYRPFHFYLF